MVPFSDIGDPRLFEQLCYELLPRLGFHNVRWRGPGADGGRDIEAEWFFEDPSGHFTRQTWYIECKYYTHSVPYEEVAPKLLAAERDNKDCLLLITSSAIRNTCMDAVDKWLQNRQGRPAFRYWNGQDLSRRVVQFEDLVETYFASISLSAGELRRQSAFAQEAESAGVRTRLGSQLLQLSQSIAGHIECSSDFRQARNEAAVLSAFLESLGAIDQVQRNPSTRALVIQDILRVVEATAKRRVPITVAMPTEPVFADTSFPLLLAALHELVSNASMYAVDRVDLELRTTGGAWYLRVANNRTEDGEPAPWPTLGWRGATAKRLYPSGAGHGCWLAQSLVDAIGHRVEWGRERDKWVVEIHGLLAEGP